MSTLRRLPKHLRDALGSDASEELLTIIDEIRADRAAFRDEMRADRAAFRDGMRTEFGSFREEMRSEFASFRTEMRAEFAGFRRELRTEIPTLVGTEVRTQLQEFEGRQTAQFAAVRVEIEGVKSDLMKWSFVFWCGAVAAIAALAGVLRQ
jgi:hypothetical protein